MSDYTEKVIPLNSTAREALARLDSIQGSKTLFVVDESGAMVGTLTDGDIRRGLINGKEISYPVAEFMFVNFKYLQKNYFTIDQIVELRKKQVTLVPLVDENKRLLKIVDFTRIRSILPVEAVVMAGGRGERLRPMTDLVPKPLLRVGNKPIIEYNIDRLASFGIEKIHISIKYLGEQIQEYFGDGSSKDISISYITEDEPLGTLGALSLVENFEQETVLVMNSDLLTNIDFEDFYRSFTESGADMIVASIPYQVNVPYAVLETNDQRISSFKEKPTFTYYSNAGIYLIRRSVLELLPKGKHYNATDLMEDLIGSGRQVLHFPLLGYWLDVGKPEDFKKAQEDIKHLSL